MPYNGYLLRDLIDIKHGFAFPGDLFSDDLSFPTLITPGNFKIGGGFQEAKPKTFSGEFSEEYILKPGDLIVTMTDLSKAGDSLGYSAVVPHGRTYLHNQRVGKVVNKHPELLSLKYLNWFMRTKDYRNFVMGSATGTTVRHTSPSRILEIEIFLPPHSMQRTIADLLDLVDSKINLNVDLAKTLEGMAQAIYKSWFIDFDPVKAKMAGEKPEGMDAATAALFPDSMEDSELGSIPIGWEACQLNSVLELHKATIKAGAATESVPYVPIDQIGARDIFLKNSMPGSNAKTSLVSFEKNEILFGAMRPYFHKVVLAPFKGTTRTTTFVLGVINPIYLSYSLLTVYQDNAVAYATNHSQGTTIPYAVWNNSFENYPIVLPSESIAKAFNDLVLPLIEFGYSLVTENQKLVQIRDGLLPRLISGELQIPEEMLAS